MKRLLVVLCACLFVAAPSPRRNEPAAPMLTPWQESWGAREPGVAFHVCLEEQNGTTTINVLGPPTTLTPAPSEHVKQQTRNAIKSLAFSNYPRPELLTAIILFGPDAVSRPQRKQPGSWDEDGRGSKGRCLHCVCAEALYSSNKQFSGCSVSSCDSCQICRPCESQ